MTTNEIEEIVKRFKMEFIVERVTKVEISDEKEFTYVAKPTDLKGHEATEAILSFLRQSLFAYGEKCKEEERERIKLRLQSRFKNFGNENLGKLLNMTL